MSRAFNNLDIVLSVFDSMRDYMCVHRPVLGPDGTIVDCELLSWNAAYEKVRTKKVERGQLMMDTYFMPESAMAHVNTAWRTGRSYQHFELSADDGDRYRAEGSEVSIEVRWQRANHLIIEIGSDFSEFQKMQRQLQRRELDVAYSEQAAAVAEERERIARDMHDTIIQNLISVALRLDIIKGAVSDSETREALNGIHTTISGTIADIRREILDVRNFDNLPLSEQINAAASPMIEATGATLSVVSAELDLPARVCTNLRAVVREAVSNAIRHGGARTISVNVAEASGIVSLTIENDGSPLPTSGLYRSGTQNMARRAELLGGVMTLVNTDTGSVRLEWRVPMAPDGPR